MTALSIGETAMELQAMTSNSTERHHTDMTVQQETQRKKCRGSAPVLEGLLLTVIVLVLFVIYSIPTIYFVNPPLDLIQVSELLPVTNPNCSPRSPYLGQVCQQELSFQTKACLSNSSQGMVEIPVANQEIVEKYLEGFFTVVFPNFNPSPKCGVAFRSFLCLHLFGACDDNSSVLATRETCTDVRDGVCEREWSQVHKFFVSGGSGLPTCEDLPVGNTNDCLDLHVQHNGPTSGKAVTQLNCSDFFYFNASMGVCRPQCGWNPHIDQISPAVDSALRTFAYIMLIGFSAINIVLGSTLQSQVVLKFPPIYFYFVNFDTMAIGILLVISQNNPSLICEQQDYILNVLTSTSAYCSVVGFVETYASIQITYLMMFYSVMLFWAINFPFKYKQAKEQGRFKSIFIITTILSFVLPLLSLILLVDGFAAANFLNQSCVSRSPLVHFLLSTLHLSLLQWLLVSALAINVWTLFKNLTWVKVGTTRKCGGAELAEAKLLGIVVYSVITTIILLALRSYTASVTPNLYLNALLPYFICESTGVDETRSCLHLLSDVQQPQLFNLSRASTIIIAMLPLFLFLLTSDFRLYWNCTKKVHHKIRSSCHICRY